MWELDNRKGWAPKNGCLWAMVLERTRESPLKCKEIKPVNPKGNWPWIFIGSTDAEAESPICWPPDAKGRLIGKDPDGGKDWRQEEKGITEDETVGWYHRLTGHEFEQMLQDGYKCCKKDREHWRAAAYGVKELDITEQLNSDNSHMGPSYFIIFSSRNPAGSHKENGKNAEKILLWYWRSGRTATMNSTQTPPIKKRGVGHHQKTTMKYCS